MKAQRTTPMPVPQLLAIMESNADKIANWADDNAQRWIWLRDISSNPEAKGHAFAQSLILWIVDHAGLTEGQCAAIDRWQAPKDDKQQFRFRRRKWKGNARTKDKGADEGEQQNKPDRAAMLSGLEAVVQVKFSEHSAWEAMAAFNSPDIATEYAKACRDNACHAYRVLNLNTGDSLLEFTNP